MNLKRILKRQIVSIRYASLKKLCFNTQLLTTPTYFKVFLTMKLIYFTLFIIVITISGMTGYLLQTQEGVIAAGSPQIVRRPDFTLSDIQGNFHSSQDWDGKVVIINFWATWCPPCIREIPIFIELQKIYGEKGLQFVGIAVDELALVKQFSAKKQINYPILVSQQESLTIARQFGLKIEALPFTAIVDRSGNIRARYARQLNQPTLEEVILPLLSEKMNDAT